MPDNNVIHFNQDDYNRLIGAVGADQTDLENKFLKPGPGMMLDGSLDSFVKPGASTWGPCQAVKNGAHDFGGSVSAKLGQVDDDWTGFVKSLKSVSDVFQHSNDLANMSAQDFRNQYPDFGVGSGGSGGSSGGGSGSK